MKKIIYGIALLFLLNISCSFAEITYREVSEENIEQQPAAAPPSAFVNTSSKDDMLYITRWDSAVIKNSDNNITIIQVSGGSPNVVGVKGSPMFALVTGNKVDFSLIVSDYYGGIKSSELAKSNLPLVVLYRESSNRLNSIGGWLQNIIVRENKITYTIIRDDNFTQTGKHRRTLKPLENVSEVDVMLDCSSDLSQSINQAWLSTNQ